MGINIGEKVGDTLSGVIAKGLGASRSEQNANEQETAEQKSWRDILVDTIHYHVMFASEILESEEETDELLKNIQKAISAKGREQLMNEGDFQKDIFGRGVANDNYQLSQIGESLKEIDQNTKDQIDSLSDKLNEKDAREELAKSLGENMLPFDIFMNLYVPNLLMFITPSVLATIGKPELAAGYASWEVLATAIPPIPGMPEVTRLLYFSLARGIQEGVRNYRRNEKTSLIEEISRSVAIGFMTVPSFGYLLTPIAFFLRKLSFEISSPRLIKILKNSKDLHDLMRKYGVEEERVSRLVF